MVCGLQALLAQQNPLTEPQPVVWGQGYSENRLVRFPADAQSSLPADAWASAAHTSGLQLRFRSNASSITISYAGSSYTANPWYSAVGANGFDLYARKGDGRWYWCHPNSLAIGSTFAYSNLQYSDPQYAVKGYEYCLYLPSSISLSSLTMVTNSSAQLEFVPVDAAVKPIVFYGGSAIGGVAATRPGNGLTNIVSRSLPSIPVVNLGLDTAARMLPQEIALVNKLDAQIYVLDALSNLYASPADIKSLYVNAVDSIKAQHPNAAIILTEHIGYADMNMYLPHKNIVATVNAQLQAAYDEIGTRNYSGIRYLSRTDIGLNPATDFADNVHLNGKGMYLLAGKYTDVIASILSSETYHIYFVDNDVKVDSQQVSDGGLATPIQLPDRLNYSFEGWYYNNVAWNFQTPVHQNLTLTARWQINTYTVTFAGDNTSHIPPQTVNHGSPATRPADPVRDGYTFSGWYNGEAEWNFATAITAPITLTAKWTSSSTAVTTTTTEILSVYPNPTGTGWLSIANLSSPAGAKVEVYTINGSLVAVHNVSVGSETTISIAALPAGTYVVKLGNRVAKVVKK
jgi:uncharacterized repeat protein (TIGR02543 family)